MVPSDRNAPNENSPLLKTPGPNYTEISDSRAVSETKTTSSNNYVICATFIGVFIASIDESLVLSNFSTIASQFHHLSQGSWLVVAYNFGYCVSLPVYGALSDTYGRKNVLLFSYIFFALSCLACGACLSLMQLVLARVLAGLSGAGMVALVSIIIMDLVPPSDVALYRSYENVANVIGRSVGAPLGGFLSDTIGWRWSFLGQIPLVILCTLVVYGLPASLNQTEQENETENQKPSRLCEIDFFGLFTLSMTILSLLFVLQTLGMREEDQLVPTWSLALGFAISAMVFIFTEVFFAKKPLVPMNLLLQDLGGYCMVQWLLFAGRTAFISNIVPYFTRVEKYSDLFASMMYVQLSVGVLVGSIFSGYIMKRMKVYKPMGIVSLSVTIFAFFLIFLTWRDGCNVWKSFPLSIIGIAPGILFQTTFLGMSYSSPKEYLSICIGAYYLFQQLGTITGPAVGAALIQRNFKKNLAQHLMNIPDKEAVINNIVNNLRFAESLSVPLQQIVRSSYLNAFQFLPVFSLVATAAVLPFLIFLKEKRTD